MEKMKCQRWWVNRLTIKSKKPGEWKNSPDLKYYNKIFDLCFSKRDPFIIRRTPAAIPVASTQIPITRLDTADDPIALYIFSFIKTNLLKLTKFNILIHSYFNTTSVDIATWICYSWQCMNEIRKITRKYIVTEKNQEA